METAIMLDKNSGKSWGGKKKKDVVSGKMPVPLYRKTDSYWLGKNHPTPQPPEPPQNTQKTEKKRTPSPHPKPPPQNPPHPPEEKR